MSRIIICGKSCSGKDTLRIRLQERGFVYGLPYTTRSPRSNEIDGKDYYFISENNFKEGLNKNLWYQYNNYNDWYYGITKDQFYNVCNLFIMPPAFINKLSTTDRKNSFIIYLDPPQETIIKRMEKRGDMPGDSFRRRINADIEDFKDFKDFDLKIADEQIYNY